MRALFVLILLWICIAGKAQINSEPAVIKPPAKQVVIEDETDTGDTTRRVKKVRVHAGADISKAFFLINGGLAVPLGNYGSTSLYNVNSLFAQAGYDVNIEGGLTLYKWIGLSATAGIMANKADLEEIVTLGNYYFGGIITSNFEPGSYRYIYASAGLLVSIPVRDYFDIDIKLHGGVANGTDGKFSFTGTDTTGFSYQYEFDKISDVTFMPNVGVTIRKKISGIWTIAVNANYKGAQFDFENRKAYRNGLSATIQPYSIQMHELTVGLGLGVSF
jgi:hypothetical protein